MDTIISLLAILSGVVLRLAIPLVITAAIIYFLRKLDTRWQKEGQMPVLVDKPKCWETNNCPSDQVKNCIGAQSPFPCWQARRLPNGYLREECITCKVFLNAPIPHNVQPRRITL